MSTDLYHIHDYLKGDLAEADKSEVNQLSLLVESDLISFHHVQLPDAPKSKWDALLPWILEDQLLLPVEDLHFVICSVDTERMACVISVPKKEIHRLQLLLENSDGSSAGEVEQDLASKSEAQGLVSRAITALIPDVLALPLEEGFISLTKLDDRLLVRSAEYEGFSGKAHFVWAALALIQSQKEVLDEPMRLQCFGIELELLPDWARPNAKCTPKPIDWSLEALGLGSLPPGANLLVGEYRPKPKRIKLGAWMPSLITASLALILFCAWITVDHLKNGQELVQINNLLVDEFEANFSAPVSRLDTLRRRGAEIISDKEVRYFSVESSILAAIAPMDTALSNCSDCLISALKIEPQQAQLEISNNPGLLGALSRMDGVESRASEPDENDMVLVSLEFAPPAGAN